MVNQEMTKKDLKEMLEDVRKYDVYGTTYLAINWLAFEKIVSELEKRLKD